MSDKHSLSPQLKVFAQAVADGKEISVAHEMAYPKPCKESTRLKRAQEVAARPAVAAEIERLKAQAEVREYRRIADEEIIEILSDMIRTDGAAEIMKEVGTTGMFSFPANLKPGTQLGRAVASMERTPDGKIKYKFYDRIKAIETLAKFEGRNQPEKVEHEAGPTLATLMAEIARHEGRKYQDTPESDENA